MAAKKASALPRHRLRPGQLTAVFMLRGSASEPPRCFWSEKLAEAARVEADPANEDEELAWEAQQGIVDENGGIWVNGTKVTVLNETPGQMRERAIKKLRHADLTEDELATVLSPEILARVVERGSR
jgi:hypothetical protein